MVIADLVVVEERGSLKDVVSHQGILENMNENPGILCVRTYKKDCKLNGIQSSTSKSLSITSWTGRVGLGGVQ